MELHLDLTWLAWGNWFLDNGLMAAHDYVCGFAWAAWATWGLEHIRLQHLVSCRWNCDVIRLGDSGS
jgi:hypothetical protein